MPVSLAKSSPALKTVRFPVAMTEFDAHLDQESVPGPWMHLRCSSPYMPYIKDGMVRGAFAARC